MADALPYRPAPHELQKEGLVSIKPHLIRSMTLVDRSVEHIEKL
jgi:hypothetical protein